MTQAGEVAQALCALHEEVDARVARIRAAQPDWLCAKGCAACCRSLADVPQLTPGEWDLLREGLSQLPADTLQRVRARAAALPAAGPLVCPMLDEATNACPVYLHRPVACRSYGFYVRRAHGLYCGDIEAQVAAGRLAEVVWGNHEVVERELAALGAAKPLTAWLAGWSGPA